MLYIPVNSDYAYNFTEVARRFRDARSSVLGLWVPALHSSQRTGTAVYDLSGWSLDLAMSGNAAWASGQYGSHITCPGIAEVASSASISNAGPITVLYVVQTVENASTSDYMIEATGSRYWRIELYSESTHSFRFVKDWSGGDVIASTPSSTWAENEWAVYVLTWNNLNAADSDVRWWKNGVELSLTRTTGGSEVNGTGPVQFGAWNDESNPATINFAMVGLWDHVLTDGQIQDISNDPFGLVRRRHVHPVYSPAGGTPPAYNMPAAMHHYRNLRCAG